MGNRNELFGKKIETRNHIKMSESSKEFLEAYLPEALEAESCRDLEIMLDHLINLYGFAPPDCLHYNKFGRIAQMVYDDIYNSNDDENDEEDE